MSDAGRMFSDGALYERMMGRWSRLVADQFLDWLAVPNGLRWIDVGCGNGAFTETLIARCAPSEVTAVDPSEGQLAYARTRPDAKLAQFRVGDAQALPFGDNSFDAAAMALVISFVPDPAKAAAEMARVVRPGGMVATYMWDIPGGGLPVHPVRPALSKIGIAPIQAPGFEHSRMEAMQGFWQAAGLQSIETSVIRIPVTFSSLDDFWDSAIVPVGPQGKLFAELTTDQREALRKTLREQLPIAADGRIAYQAFANAVKGRVPE